LRMALEPLVPRSAPNGDESIGHFIRRRLGREALDQLAEPLMGGIYAGDVEALSMRATFPQLLELERRHGSLIRGAIAQRKALRDKPPVSTFFSLLGGMGELIDTLARAASDQGARIRAGLRV